MTVEDGGIMPRSENKSLVIVTPGDDHYCAMAAPPESLRNPLKHVDLGTSSDAHVRFLG